MQYLLHSIVSPQRIMAIKNEQRFRVAILFIYLLP